MTWRPNSPVLVSLVGIRHDWPDAREPFCNDVGSNIASLSPSPAALGLLAQSGVRARGAVCRHRKHKKTSFGFVATNMRSEPVKCPSTTFAENFMEEARTR